MNDATRQLIEMSLRVRSIDDTVSLFARAITGEEITRSQVAGIRARMVGRGELNNRGPSPSHFSNLDPIACHDGAVKAIAARGSEQLRSATQGMFERKAHRLGCSVEAAAIHALYSPEHIARSIGMAA